jgi:hypothetical protein
LPLISILSPRILSMFELTHAGTGNPSCSAAAESVHWQPFFHGGETTQSSTPMMSEQTALSMKISLWEIGLLAFCCPGTQAFF